MDVKKRVLLLARYLQENSDEDHQVSTQEIVQYLEVQDCPVTPRTLRTDIQTLQDCDIEVAITETEGLTTTYGWMTRVLEAWELQIIVDALSSAQFISPKKTGELIGKLVSMAAPSVREQLQPQILVSERTKAPNDQIFHIVQEIREAIRQDRMISFRYYTYNTEKERVQKRKDGKIRTYHVSPYDMIWNNDRYYLICKCETHHEDYTTFRIDKMEIPKILAEKRKPMTADYNPQDFTDKVFWMYNGKMENVTLRCRHSLMDQVIDKFGRDVTVHNVKTATFDITVPVSVSSTFYAWVALYAGEMHILRPAHVANSFVEYLNQAIDDTLGAIEYEDTLE